MAVTPNAAEVMANPRAPRRRRVLSGVALVLACLSILVTTVALWTHQVALNTNRFTTLIGNVASDPTVTDPIFGVEVPTSCPDVPSEFLQPRSTWADPDAYDRQANALAHMFAENFTAYADGVSESVRAAGPRVDDHGAPELPVAGPGEG